MLIWSTYVKAPSKYQDAEMVNVASTILGDGILSDFQVMDASKGNIFELVIRTCFTLFVGIFGIFLGSPAGVGVSGTALRDFWLCGKYFW